MKVCACFSLSSSAVQLSSCDFVCPLGKKISEPPKYFGAAGRKLASILGYVGLQEDRLDFPRKANYNCKGKNH